MQIGKKNSDLVNAVAELKSADYSREPELNAIYQRLVRSREQFVELLEKNVKAVMQISSLDLTMQHETDKILAISNNVEQATQSLFGSSGSSNNQQEELTNTIVGVSEEVAEVYKKIEDCQRELTGIRDLSSQTIQISSEMQTDM